MKPILVTTYVNPDLDGLAGTVAYAEFLQKRGRNALAAIIGESHAEAKYVLDRFGFAYPETISNADNFDEVIIIDASDPNAFDGNIAAEKVVEIIDHRKIHAADKFPNAKVQIELVGAAATLVAEKFMENKVNISSESAILLCSAIISNTLNFKATVTTDRDKKVRQWLNMFAGLPENFYQELFTAKSDLSGAKLVKQIKREFGFYILNGKRVGIAQIEMIGAEKLIAARGAEIMRLLNEIKSDRDLDYIFQNTIELEGGKSFFVTNHGPTKTLLDKVLDTRFVGIAAASPQLLMRKQIVPLLLDFFQARKNR